MTLSGKGTPLRLVLGKSKMIAGWEEGITTMVKGEISMVISFNFLPKGADFDLHVVLRVSFLRFRDRRGKHYNL